MAVTVSAISSSTEDTKGAALSSQAPPSLTTRPTDGGDTVTIAVHKEADVHSRFLHSSSQRHLCKRFV